MCCSKTRWTQQTAPTADHGRVPPTGFRLGPRQTHKARSKKSRFLTRYFYHFDVFFFNKKVRWADLEEQKQQEKMRAIGFVVGHTNWDRMMDPTMGGSALTQTKYIERTGRFKVGEQK